MQPARGPRTLIRTRRQLLLALLSASASASCAGLGAFGRARVVGAREPRRVAVPAFSGAPGATCLRVAALGDVGEGNAGQRRVAEALEVEAQAGLLDGVLLLGDLFYEDGVSSLDDPQWDAKFQRVYGGPLRDLPFWPALGNHDHRGEPRAYVDYGRRDPRWRMPARYYAADLAGDAEGGRGLARVFVLDSTAALRDDAERAAQLAWLDGALAASPAAWNVVALHHPIDSGGCHGPSAALARELLPILVRHRVPLVLGGHDHHLALMELPGGVLQAISGAGATTRDVRWTDNTLFASTELGFARLAFARDAAVIRFVAAGGEELYAYPLSAGGSSEPSAVAGSQARNASSASPSTASITRSPSRSTSTIESVNVTSTSP